jgi:hypothetical protein
MPNRAESLACPYLGLTSALLNILAHFRTTGSKASKLLPAAKTKHKFHMYSFLTYLPPSPFNTLGKPMTLYSSFSPSASPSAVVSRVTNLPWRDFLGMMYSDIGAKWSRVDPSEEVDALDEGFGEGEE